MASIQKVLEVVADPEWQKFRLSLKGLPTETKLDKLHRYYEDQRHNQTSHFAQKEMYECDVCVRIDNYIKALCRGGQLKPGENINTVRLQDWRPIVRK